MSKDHTVYLTHIKDAVRSIEAYTVGGEQVFLESKQIQDAVIYNLAVIGEAVKRLPLTVRQSEPTIAWKSIAGLRDVVIHDYDSTDIPRVWNVVAHDLPRLKKAIARMLRASSGSGTNHRRAG